MSSFGLPEFARMGREALSGGDPVAFGVVVAAPENPGLVGRRLAWDGESLRGELDDPAATRAARELLEESGEEAGVRAVPGTGIEMYVERIAPPPELVIVGAGHIAQPLCGIGKLLGWEVAVLDDRPEFARTDRFPEADRVLVADFDDPFAEVSIGPRTRLVLVTRGHRYDYDCLRALAAAGADPAYLGMIGSRRRVRAAFEQLAGEGVDPEWIARIYAPVGLDVGSETPAEIAVAVAAEMVLAHRGGTGRPLRDEKEVVRYVKALQTAPEAS
ncbi:MAG: XdhC family protein [Gemmatimonadota bacterium]|nr:XdhC family protein [Gemmatimonadota bacterium]